METTLSIPSDIVPYFQSFYEFLGDSDEGKREYYDIMIIPGEWDQTVWYWIIYRLSLHTEIHGGYEKARLVPFDLSLDTIRAELVSPFPLLRMLEKYRVDSLFTMLIDLLMTEMRERPSSSEIYASVTNGTLRPHFPTSYKELVVPFYAKYRSRVEESLCRLIGQSHREMIQKKIMAHWIPSIGNLTGIWHYGTVYLTPNGIQGLLFANTTGVNRISNNTFFRLPDIIGFSAVNRYIAVLKMDGLCVAGEIQINNSVRYGMYDNVYVVPITRPLSVKCSDVCIVVRHAGGLCMWYTNEISRHGFQGTRINIEVPGIIRSYDVGGLGHVIILTTEGLFVYGNNEHGQLGIGKVSQPVTKPIMLEDFDAAKITSVHCGHDYTMILMADYSVYAFGANQYCQLGLRSKNVHTELDPHVGDRPLPTRVLGPGVAASVACGRYHVVIKRQDGLIIGAGAFDNGQLGKVVQEERIEKTDAYKDKNEPFFFEIKDLDNDDVLDIECHRDRTFIVTSGAIYELQTTLYKVDIDFGYTSKNTSGQFRLMSKK